MRVLFDFFINIARWACLNRWDLGEVFSDFFLGRVFKRPALLKLFFCQYLLGRDHVQNRFNAPRRKPVEPRKSFYRLG